MGQVPAGVARARSAEKRQAEKRRRLLDAGLELLEELPFGEITVAMVAERAEMAKGLVFYYFGDKDGLFREVVSAFLHLRRPLFLGNEVSAAGDPDAWLRAEVDLFLGLVLAHPRAMATVMDFARPGTGEEWEATISASRGFLVDRVRGAYGLPADDPLLDAVLHSWAYQNMDLAQRLAGSPGWDRAVVREVLAAELRAALDVIGREWGEG